MGADLSSRCMGDWVVPESRTQPVLRGADLRGCTLMGADIKHGQHHGRQTRGKVLGPFGDGTLVFGHNG